MSSKIFTFFVGYHVYMAIGGYFLAKYYTNGLFGNMAFIYTYWITTIILSFAPIVLAILFFVITRVSVYMTIVVDATQAFIVVASVYLGIVVIGCVYYIFKITIDPWDINTFIYGFVTGAILLLNVRWIYLICPRTEDQMEYVAAPSRRPPPSAPIVEILIPKADEQIEGHDKGYVPGGHPL